MSEDFSQRWPVQQMQKILDRLTYREGWRFKAEVSLTTGSPRIRIWPYADAVGIQTEYFYLPAYRLNGTYPLNSVVAFELAMFLIEMNGTDGADDLMFDGVSVGKQIKALAG